LDWQIEHTSRRFKLPLILTLKEKRGCVLIHMLDGKSTTAPEQWSAILIHSWQSARWIMKLKKPVSLGKPVKTNIPT